MFGKTICGALLIAALATACCMFASCGAAEDEEVDCVIGVTSVGDQYTATIELPDRSWEDLTAGQKENVVEQCVETVELSIGTAEENGEAGGTEYDLTGVDQKTKEQIFTYSSKEQKTVFE